MHFPIPGAPQACFRYVKSSFMCATLIALSCAVHGRMQSLCRDNMQYSITAGEVNMAKNYSFSGAAQGFAHFFGEKVVIRPTGNARAFPSDSVDWCKKACSRR
jgi:hypothetical protein